MYRSVFINSNTIIDPFINSKFNINQNMINIDLVLFNSSIESHPIWTRQYFYDHVSSTTVDRDLKTIKTYKDAVRQKIPVIAFGGAGSIIAAYNDCKLLPSWYTGGFGSRTIKDKFFKSEYEIPGSISRIIYPYKLDKEDFFIFSYTKVDTREIEQPIGLKLDKYLNIPEIIYFKKTKTLIVNSIIEHDNINFKNFMGNYMLYMADELIDETLKKYEKQKKDESEKDTFIMH